jgi:hypothetical protein
MVLKYILGPTVTLLVASSVYCISVSCTCTVLYSLSAPYCTVLYTLGVIVNTRRTVRTVTVLYSVYCTNQKSTSGQTEIPRDLGSDT